MTIERTVVMNRIASDMIPGAIVVMNGVEDDP